MATLRERNRLAAMRETQYAALRLFRERGFDEVTVEEVAAAAEIAPSTVYRHFGFKEALVLWDEGGGAVEAALSRRLVSQAPLSAIRDAFVDVLGERYEADLEFHLERIGYIYETEALHGAAVEADYLNRAELTDALEQILPQEHVRAAAILAGAALLALDVAIDRWQQQRAAIPLPTLIREAFTTLEGLADFG